MISSAAEGISVCGVRAQGKEGVPPGHEDSRPTLCRVGEEVNPPRESVWKFDESMSMVSKMFRIHCFFAGVLEMNMQTPSVSKHFDTEGVCGESVVEPSTPFR
ncbi:hypothetical protein [Streptomyces sp. NPDC058758]|uniref:hypothetical protein n=1 Tax=Streptomyces sp. NPDC058758 TaxID=3346627 RepID=UPI003690FD1D